MFATALKKVTIFFSLRTRQKQWAAQESERKANEPDPDMPEGHRLMPDAERRETLEKLKSSMYDLYN